MLCEYGCGKESKYQLKNGKLCCEKGYQKCPSNKVIPWNKGKKNIYSKETLNKMKEKKIGKIVSQETKIKISNSTKGKKKSQEHSKKISIALKGKIKTIEHRKNLSISQKGKPRKKHTEETKKLQSYIKLGSLNPFYGKHHTEENKIKMSRPEEQNPNWRGGISKEPYSFSFTKKLKDSIKKRDKYKCIECNNKNRLCVHHIDYIKKNCEKTNLITLCRSCHTKTNFNRKYWRLYFQERF